MVLTLIALVLILAIAFYQVIQGLFSAMIMTILSIICATAAFLYYQPIAELLYEDQPACADGLALVVLFVIPLFGLRFAFDKYVPGNVVMGVWADRIAGGFLGLITGMIMVGTLAVAIQMMPFGESVLGYEPFDASLQRRKSIAPFSPDQFTVGMVSMLSAGSLSGESSFSDAHDDLLLELFCERNTAGKNGRTDAQPESIRDVTGYFPPPASNAQGRWRKDVPDYPLMPTSATARDFVLRASVDANARNIHSENNSDFDWYLPGTHFRLVTNANRSYYPVAYLTFLNGQWKAHAVIDEDEGHALPGSLILSRSEPRRGNLTVDWVYKIPKEEIPAYVVFRRTTRVSNIRVTNGVMPTYERALNRKVKRER